MMNGKIKTLVGDKGYGFIDGEDGKHYFFHYSNLVDMRFESLTTGMPVIFDDTMTPKGARAEFVREVE